MPKLRPNDTFAPLTRACASRWQLNNLDTIVPNSLAASGTPVSPTDWSAIVSGFGIGGLLGCAAATQLCQQFGRKTVLLLNNIFVVSSSLLFIFGASWSAFFAVRVLVGIAAGIATGVVPLYLSEICPSSARAAVGTAHQLGIAFGLLLSQVLTTPELCSLGGVSSWRGVFLVPMACAILEVLVLPFCPESPAYLYKTLGSSAALSSLATLQSAPSASGSLDLLRCEMVDRGFSSYSVPRLFQATELRKQLVVGLAIQVSVQLSGIDAIFYYSTLVFRHAGLAQAELASTSLGLVNVAMTLVAIWAMYRAGRRVLLLCGWLGMCAAYLLLTYALVGAQSGATSVVTHYLAVVAMGFVLVAFAIGPGSVAWFVIAEIFPPHARDAAMALGVVINWLTNWFVAYTFPILHELLGSYVFLPFAASTAFFAVLILRRLPETRNKHVDDITWEFGAM